VEGRTQPWGLESRHLESGAKTEARLSRGLWGGDAPLALYRLELTLTNRARSPSSGHLQEARAAKEKAAADKRDAAEAKGKAAKKAERKAAKKKAAEKAIKAEKKAAKKKAAKKAIKAAKKAAKAGECASG
jgi:hypothetical protein